MTNTLYDKKFLSISNILINKGYITDTQQPSLSVILTVRQSHIDNFKLFFHVMNILTGGSYSYQPSVSNKVLAADLLGSAVRFLASMAGLPIFGTHKILARERKSEIICNITIPSIPGIHSTLRALSHELEKIINNSSSEISSYETENIINIFSKLKEKRIKGLNSLRILSIAHDKNIPWNFISATAFQLGWGSSARWFDSTFTDQTPVISTNLARDKYTSANLLRNAGIPVCDHRIARNVEEAVKIANILTYPVVVKAADLDGGVGVYVGLTTPDDVISAYNKASKLSHKILIERYIHGNDYRIQVIHGVACWATHRIPGGITGDGEKSVNELIDILNSDPRRGSAETGALLKTIHLDEEAVRLLNEQGLTADDVPQQGRFIRLRRAANIASGGTPVQVLEQAHPDNLQLAVRAARILRLDVAGIDLLTPDISISWRDAGGAICEVNAQPQMSSGLLPELLNRMVKNNGRIPVILLVGDIFPEWATTYFQNLKSINIGIYKNEAIHIKNELISSNVKNLYTAGNIIISDPHSDAAVLHINGDDFMRDGLPIDRADIVIFGSPIHGITDQKRYARLADILIRLSNTAILTPDSGPWESIIHQMTPHSPEKTPSPDKIIDKIIYGTNK